MAKVLCTTERTNHNEHARYRLTGKRALVDVACCLAPSRTSSPRGCSFLTLLVSLFVVSFVRVRRAINHGGHYRLGWYDISLSHSLNISLILSHHTDTMYNPRPIVRVCANRFHHRPREHRTVGEDRVLPDLGLDRTVLVDARLSALQVRCGLRRILVRVRRYQSLINLLCWLVGCSFATTILQLWW